MSRKKDNDDLRSRRQLEKLKWETAQQLGLDDDLKDPDELSVREAGKIGGNMVRKLIKKGEEAIAEEGGRIAQENIRDKRENQKR